MSGDPKDVLIRMLTERYPEEVAEILRELGYDVQAPEEPRPFLDREMDDPQAVLDLTLGLLDLHDTESAGVEFEIPGEIWMGKATEPIFGMYVGEQVLVNVHGRDKCADRHCVLHNPSDHHMREWPLVWRGDKRVMERHCSHEVGHPDPDDLAYQLTIGREGVDIHGCDGCCRP